LIYSAKKACTAYHRAPSKTPQKKKKKKKKNWTMSLFHHLLRPARNNICPCSLPAGVMHPSRSFAEFQSFLQFGLLAQKRLALLLTTRNPTGNEKKPLQTLEERSKESSSGGKMQTNKERIRGRTATRFPVETDADNIASSDIHKTAPEPLSFSSTLTTLHLTAPRESPSDAEGFLNSLLLLSLLLTPFVGVCRFPELRREPAMRARTRGRRR